VIQTKTGSQSTARKSLILMEAAIGIEPMNKGFADHSKHVSLNVIEHHRRVNIGFFSAANTP